MAITLTQTQIIQSLGEALSWFERELNWGVKPAELRHLTGRIGELYVAMTTRGQMALESNQRGYDVVSAEGQRISVKTVTSSTHAKFRKNTLDQAQRIVILQLRVDEETGISIEELLNEPLDTARRQLREKGKDLYFPTRPPRPTPSLDGLKVTDEADWHGTIIRRYENGQIVVVRDDQQILPAKPELRTIAKQVGVAIEADNGRVKTTHQLGSHIIKAIKDAQHFQIGAATA